MLLSVDTTCALLLSTKDTVCVPHCRREWVKQGTWPQMRHGAMRGGQNMRHCGAAQQHSTSSRGIVCANALQQQLWSAQQVRCFQPQAGPPHHTEQHSVSCVHMHMQGGL